MESDGKIIIRKAFESEWEQAMELAWKTFLKFEADEYGEEGKKNFLDFISNEQLFQMFLTENYKLSLALCEGKIVGMVTLRSGHHISLLFVDEKYHRKGIATALLSHIQSELEDKTLTVNSSPYGEAFYSKVGFVKTDEWTTADGITYLPMICKREILAGKI